MKGILADINIQGQVDLLVILMRAEPWLIYWDHLALPYLHFDDVDLDPEALDSNIWRLCQERELILITDNRNKDGPDSLENTIQLYSTASSLPVFTVANAQQVLHSRQYADRVIEQLFEYLMRIDTVRGTGRLFLP